jgi:hypothetical protein
VQRQSQVADGVADWQLVQQQGDLHSVAAVAVEEQFQPYFDLDAVAHE